MTITEVLLVDNSYMTGDIVMNATDISGLADYRQLHLQSVRKIIITVEVLDKDLNTIETIQGLSTGGSINISSESLLRRTGSLSFTLVDYLMPKQESLLWITNRIRIYVGIENASSLDSDITHFCIGTFYITEPNIDIDSASRSITITLEDNMMKWDQEELERKLVIEAGTPLHTAVEELMRYYGEFNIDVEFTELTIPYKLEFSEGDNISSVLTKLRDLYMDWVCYYDVEGIFRFKKMQIQREDGEPISWSFVNEGDHITSFKESFTYKELKNKVIVIGSTDEKTGLTPRAEAKITNEESPFHEDKIGIKKKVIADSSLSTESQCNAKARYELFKSSTFQERLDITTAPIYFLDGNDIVEIIDPTTNKPEKFIIDSISLGLGVGEEMSISTHKLYFDHFDVDSSLEKSREIADIVSEGILNKGWLSLSEKRIEEYYGLIGSGSRVIIRFEKGSRYGTTAYVTGYVGDSTQTLTVDLADFESYGDNGDTGAGKAEYSDRILGHETVHILMNDVFGVIKTINMPTWFKEGAAELIHGADERLKISIVESGSINDSKLDSIIQIAVNMLNSNAWKGDNDTYSASYLILKYLDKCISANKSMKDLMKSIKDSKSTGGTAVKDAIVANTSFTKYEDFVSDFKANAKAFVKTRITLNLIGDEQDTGSIGGTDHRGTKPLNAEDVFDNSKAVKGVALNNFKVEFDKP